MERENKQNWILVGVECVVRAGVDLELEAETKFGGGVGENNLEGPEPPAVRVRGRGWIPRNELRGEGRF